MKECPDFDPAKDLDRTSFEIIADTWAYESNQNGVSPMHIMHVDAIAMMYCIMPCVLISHINDAPL